MIVAYTVGSSDEYSLCANLETHLLTNTSGDAGSSGAHLAPDHPATSESSCRSWAPSSGHSPDRPTAHVVSSGECETSQLSSIVPLEQFQSSRLDSTPCLHSITMNRQGTFASEEYCNTSDG